MSWKTLDRRESVVDPQASPVLSEAVRAKICAFLDRYAEKRAALLPALWVVQNTLGHVPFAAMVEIAELLEIPPSAVLDTITFYTHFWTHPKGKKVITVCRSLSCELMGGRAVLDELKQRLGVDEHGTTDDGEYSLVTEECLAGCDHAPCLLVNEKMCKRVAVADVAGILADENNDKLDMPRSDLFDPPEEVGETDDGGGEDETMGATSDIQEMREAD